MVSDSTIEAMEKYGGSFVKQLATLYRLADWMNKKKLEKCFKEIFDNYREMAKTLEEKG